MNKHRHTYTDVPSLFASALSGWVSFFLAKKLFTSAPDAGQEIDVLLVVALSQLLFAFTYPANVNV